MKYLVQMKLASSSRPATPQEGIAFIEQFIVPTLDLCKKLEAEQKILAGARRLEHLKMGCRTGSRDSSS